jgi:hypothetical protein
MSAVFTANCSKQRKKLRYIKVVSTLWGVDDLATALFCILYYQEKQDIADRKPCEKHNLSSATSQVMSCLVNINGT